MAVLTKRAGVTRFNQLRAYLRIHVLRKWRRPYGTAIELLFPLAFVLLVFFLVPNRTNEKDYPAVGPSNFSNVMDDSSLAFANDLNIKPVVFVRAGNDAAESDVKVAVQDLTAALALLSESKWTELQVKALDDGKDQAKLMSPYALAAITLNEYNSHSLKAIISMSRKEVELPSVNVVALPRSQCRSRKKHEGLPKEKCLTSTYLYSGFLGLQALLQCAWLSGHAGVKDTAALYNITADVCSEVTLAFRRDEKYSTHHIDRAIAASHDSNFHVHMQIFPSILVFFLSLTIPFLLRFGVSHAQPCIIIPLDRSLRRKRTT